MKGADPCVNASLLDGGTSCACEVSLTDKYGPSLMLINTKWFRNIENLRIKKLHPLLYYTSSIIQLLICHQLIMVFILTV